MHRASQNHPTVLIFAVSFTVIQGQSIPRIPPPVLWRDLSTRFLTLTHSWPQSPLAALISHILACPLGFCCVLFISSVRFVLNFAFSHYDGLNTPVKQKMRHLPTPSRPYLSDGPPFGNFDALIAFISQELSPHPCDI